MSKCRESNSLSMDVQFARDLLLAQGEGAADDGGDAVGVGGDERADDDPGALGDEREVVAAKRDGLHGACQVGAGAIECSAKFISARERWKARVDSAPWFSLTRSWCSPSLQPPVLES